MKKTSRLRRISIATFLALSHTIIVSVVAAPVPGDIDGNGVVDFQDFLILAKNYGKKGVPVALSSSGDPSDPVANTKWPNIVQGNRFWELYEATDSLANFGTVKWLTSFDNGVLWIQDDFLFYAIEVGFGDWWHEIVRYEFTPDQSEPIRFNGKIKLIFDEEMQEWEVHQINSPRVDGFELIFTREKKEPDGTVSRKQQIRWRRGDLIRGRPEVFTRPFD